MIDESSNKFSDEKSLQSELTLSSTFQLGLGVSHTVLEGLPSGVGSKKPGSNRTGGSGEAQGPHLQEAEFGNTDETDADLFSELHEAVVENELCDPNFWKGGQLEETSEHNACPNTSNLEDFKAQECGVEDLALNQVHTSGEGLVKDSVAEVRVPIPEPDATSHEHLAKKAEDDAADAEPIQAAAKKAMMQQNQSGDDMGDDRGEQQV